MRGKPTAARSAFGAGEKHPFDFSRQKFWGTITRRERWGLSWRGSSLVAMVVLFAAFLFLWRVYPFVAVTHRVDTNLLVVEGWVHNYAIRSAIEEFRGGSHQRVFTTGGPVEGTGGYINDYHASASVGAERLIKYGLPNESLQMAPSRVKDRDRTYGSAIALRNWLRDRHLPVRGINVVTENVHARRTRLLFHEALGKEVTVGVIAVPSPDYDARHWWRYSAGVKDVVSETVAFLYAKLLFYPSDSKPLSAAVEKPCFAREGPPKLPHIAAASSVVMSHDR